MMDSTKTDVCVLGATNSRRVESFERPRSDALCDLVLSMHIKRYTTREIVLVRECSQFMQTIIRCCHESDIYCTNNTDLDTITTD